jgi:uncharacterized protein YbaA (DUF1428 family)
LGDFGELQEAYMSYVDGFVMPLPKKNLAAYLRMAKKAAKIWKDNGALEVWECIGDDLTVKFGMSFAKGIKLKPKPSETVVFSWILFKSRAHRDRVNAKMAADSRCQMDMVSLPFDHKRMINGGFKTLITA